MYRERAHQSQHQHNCQLESKTIAASDIRSSQYKHWSTEKASGDEDPPQNPRPPISRHLTISPHGLSQRSPCRIDVVGDVRLKARLGVTILT